MQIRPTAFTIGLIIYSFIALFFVYTEFGIDSRLISGASVQPVWIHDLKLAQDFAPVSQRHSPFLGYLMRRQIQSLHIVLHGQANVQKTFFLIISLPFFQPDIVEVLDFE